MNTKGTKRDKKRIKTHLVDPHVHADVVLVRRAPTRVVQLAGVEVGEVGHVVVRRRAVIPVPAPDSISRNFLSKFM